MINNDFCVKGGTFGGNGRGTPKIPFSAPTGFIPESWRKVVITPSGIDRKYYEFCVLNELKGALRSGDIWVKGSRR
ncbi:hypothetical protein DMS95_25375 [Klebsiella variicola]|nr:hypothetical protein [Klebsiella pneumoniae]PXL89985.1 hypothetical protein DMS95_25375 [Klebsiella variicola]ROG14824.1 hypothetical protein C4Y63_006185 [Klebsiella pneumoniae subsp. pneumoniae]EIW9317090.1 hypothetical protein [Klebsiella pneumoniae]PXG77470.1 hypothetical protein DMP59_24425 [Klebsiella pneumoniae]